MRFPRASRAALTLVAVTSALWLFACDAIIGIPNRDLAADGGPDATAPMPMPTPTDASPHADGEADAVADAGDSDAFTMLTTSHGTLTPAFSPTTYAYAVRVSDLFGELPFTVTATNATHGARLTIDGSEVASGVPSAPFALGGARDRAISVVVTFPDGAEQHYTIHVTNGPAYTYAKPSFDMYDGHFAAAVALSGDTLAVGEPDEASAATGIDGDAGNQAMSSAGAVYVFRRSGGAWKQEAYLKASNTSEYSRFGASVALSGDTLLVGSPGESSSATGVNGDQHDTSAAFSGAVYAFARSGGAWTQEAYLKASNSRQYENFGASVALEGDTAVVGASNESSAGAADPSDTSALGTGAVYVFLRAGGAWTQEAYLKASNATYQQEATSHSAPYFGSSVALSGDRIAVGAYGESSGVNGVNQDGKDISAPGAGAAYVFHRDSGAWEQEAYVKASNRSAQFGYGVAISGGLLAVGAPYEASFAKGINGDQRASGADGAGAVYVFSLSGSTWAQEAYVKASNTSIDALFGSSVALSDDHLVVGSPGEAGKSTEINGAQSGAGRTNAGAAYVFVRTPNAWEQRAYVKASVNHAEAFFGNALAIGAGTLAVGSSKEASGAIGINGNAFDMTVPEAGAVFILE